MLCQLVSLGERQPVDRDLGQVVEDRNPVVRCVVIGGAVRDFDEQAAALVDEKWKQVIGSDQVGFNGEPEDPETVGEVVLPDGSVPLRRSSLEELRAPDVVDEHIDVAVACPDLLGQGFHLVGIEMVDCGRNPGAAEARDELGSLLDRLGAVVVGARRAFAPTAATRADDCCAGFAQGSSDAASGASGRPRYDGHATTQRVWIGRPFHALSWLR